MAGKGKYCIYLHKHIHRVLAKYCDNKGQEVSK